MVVEHLEYGDRGNTSENTKPVDLANLVLLLKLLHRVLAYEDSGPIILVGGLDPSGIFMSRAAVSGSTLIAAQRSMRVNKFECILAI